MQPRSAQVLRPELHGSSGAKERRLQDDSLFHNLRGVTEAMPLSKRFIDKVNAIRELPRSHQRKINQRAKVMYCNYCGKVIQDDAVVCAYCGVRIGATLARRKLIRPRMGRKIAGVCLGFSEYFDIDVTLVRVVWLIVACMTVIGFFSYPIAWIIMPEEPLLLPAPLVGAHPAQNP
jgi:phage shock protein C